MGRSRGLKKKNAGVPLVRRRRPGCDLSPPERSRPRRRRRSRRCRCRATPVRTPGQFAARLVRCREIWKVSTSWAESPYHDVFIIDSCVQVDIFSSCSNLLQRNRLSETSNAHDALYQAHDPGTWNDRRAAVAEGSRRPSRRGGIELSRGGVRTDVTQTAISDQINGGATRNVFLRQTVPLTLTHRRIQAVRSSKVVNCFTTRAV